MIQTAIKVVTLGFFISIISGFVLYRSGFFDADTAHYSLQKSPNGGELNNVNADQDSTKTDTIKKLQIMPSSKLLVPAFDFERSIMPSTKSMRVFEMEKIEEPKNHELLPSSKSMMHPIKIDPMNEFDPEAVKFMREHPHASSTKSVIIRDFQLGLHHLLAAPETKVGAKSIEVKLDTMKVEKDVPVPTEAIANQIEQNEKPKFKEEKPGGIAWGMIGLGVLGILFVGIGSIVYFKRRSK